ncbi:MAG: DUF721 domain-containing protein [Bacteroidetes bacterium]|nr:DUF721 domain-containing protein [Rhodothermia bacterium]MCS7154635.1 DUF721 domain-containing protein [Bacteroidota bacterium]MCX7906352.1 DUF721 domain-containing protein [Bacteroidota bacterium]MDW8137428.1 DUF721 domain-containing protein [Bacteroidota bacterium]MDW8285618.1 DUF721 domain-containing protein [Bacteroidota bacterium]
MGSPRLLGQALEDWIRQAGLEKPFYEARAAVEWFEVAGPQIARVTQKAWVERGRLYVRIASPVWRQELHLSRSHWRERINERLGRAVIEEVVFC